MRGLLRVKIARVLEQSFPDLERQVEAPESNVASLEVLDNAQGMEVVVEREPVPSHFAIQRAFPDMPERGVT